MVSPLPVPCGRRCLVSPSVQIIKNVFVKPLDSPVIQNPSIRSYNYFFSRSPSKVSKYIFFFSLRILRSNMMQLFLKVAFIDNEKLDYFI